MLLSGSRDKNLIIWNLTRDDEAYGYPKRSLEGHSHIVSDCVCNPAPPAPAPKKAWIYWESNELASDHRIGNQLELSG